ncbi:MAG TPA: hypothetical protein VF808_03620 [Ktedonobacterales bacterium]
MSEICEAGTLCSLTTQHLTAPDLRPASNQRPQSRWSGPLALVATILLVAMAASLFALLRTGAAGTGSGHASPRATPTPAFMRIIAPKPVDTKLPINRGEYLQGISFSSALDGWAVGGVIVPDQVNAANVSTHAVFIHYHDGVWSVAPDSFPNLSLNDVSMVSESEGWAVGQLDVQPNATTPGGNYTGAVLLHYSGGH